MKKKTMVLGASTNPVRYSYIAINRLVESGHEVFPLGIKKGSVAGIEIINNLPIIKDLDTITLYLNLQRQVQYYDYILRLKPKRIIFNPGTENFKLAQLAQAERIETSNACTLVLLSIDQY